jgi:general secretion pathway protein A
MSDDTINGIRLLNNLEEGSVKLIQVLLLGQEELMERINRPEMEPFKQRIATQEIIGKMDVDRMRKYVSHRIKVAGGHPSIFADTGWEALGLAFVSGGAPRLINSLCDISLNVAFDRKKTIVDIDDVYAASEGMGLGKEIFFYKIKLRDREKNEQVPSTQENDYIEKPVRLSKEPIHSFSMESDVTDIDQKGLKMPILFLLLSITALVLSIFFYCQRAGSTELMTCLQELINF